MLPLLLDLTGRLVLVVGGGPVGRRKAQVARAGGARVRVVCLEARPAELSEDGVEWLVAPYGPEHLEGACLAFAAASAEVNARVARDAKGRGVWVNVASDPSSGDFVLPAVLRRGALTVAVSTGGAAPALARQLRNHLAGALDHHLADWATLLAELRPVVLEAVPDEGERRVVFSGLAAWPWLERLRAEGVEAVRQAMRDAILHRAGPAPSGPEA
jgi:precorrin-2 dehydrogenase/sirohydrochlorin ferrochelatase